MNWVPPTRTKGPRDTHCISLSSYHLLLKEIHMSTEPVQLVIAKHSVTFPFGCCCCSFEINVCVFSQLLYFLQLFTPVLFSFPLPHENVIFMSSIQRMFYLPTPNQSFVYWFFVCFANINNLATNASGHNAFSILFSQATHPVVKSLSQKGNQNFKKLKPQTGKLIY